NLFGASAKPLLFLSVVLGELAFYVGTWRTLAWRLSHENVARIAFAAALATSAGLLVFSVLLVLFTQATLGSDTSWPAYTAVTVLSSGLYAGVAAFIAIGQNVATQQESDARRSFISVLPVLMLGGIASIIVGKVLLNSTGGGVQATHAGEPTPEVTP